ncbi:MAG: glycosyltransferase family 39 protein [Salinibacterium sp.]|nr:glycosyltransferase family 39 protein [Salinibacterium sp.]
MRGWLTHPREAIGLGALLALTAALYLVNPAVNGWANAYYSGAAQAGSMDWTAFLYGSSDPGNTITVDKPPAALWPIALSIRLFGLNAASIVLPQALMGVATVAVLYAIVRRGFPSATALIAGALAAVTPVAALMFRYNNPDALLVLLLTSAIYFTVRAIERPSAKWMALAGAAVGLGFLTKELQAFLILPALVVVYLIAAPVGLGRRVAHLLVALGALLVSAGWWVALVLLVPANARPFVGGSQSNNFLDVVLGYNGIGRLTGDGYGNHYSSASSAGIDRLLSGYIAGQIGWLLPAAVVMLAIALMLVGRVTRTDLPRAIILLFGGSLMVTTLALSFMSGIFHGYYVVAMVPGVAGLVAIGGTLLWGERRKLRARIALAVIVAGSAAWSFVIIRRYPVLDGLDWVILGLAVVASIALTLPPRGRAIAVLAVTTALASLMVGQLAYSIQTTTVAHTGSGPIAGPASGTSKRNANGLSATAAAALSTDASSFRWVVAAAGSTRAAEVQLALGHAVMPLGGYKRSDPAPTLTTFQTLVAAHAIHYLWPSATGGSSQSALIVGWVKANFPRIKVGGTDVYDLTAAPSPSNATPGITTLTSP